MSSYSGGQARKRRKLEPIILKIESLVKKELSEDDLNDTDFVITPDLDQFECEICPNTSFRNEASLKVHLDTKHSTNQCPECGKVLGDYRTLRKHRELHTRVAVPPCTVCGKPLMDEGQRGRHLKTHFGKKELELAKLLHYTCYFCGLIKRPWNAYKQHLNSHTKEKPYFCSKCPKSYTTGTLLKDHIRLKHCDPSAQAQVEEKWKFSCPHCPKKFKAKCNLEIHLPRHGVERKFSCFSCNKAFKFKPELTAHLKLHEDDCPFKCSTCGFQTTSNWKLNKHYLSHTNIRNFGCPYPNCEVRTKDEVNLKRHIATIHEVKKRAWPCQVCARVLTTEKGLETHSKLHNLQDSKWECKVCGKKLADKHRLKSHARSHLPDNREFPCSFPDCGKAYTELANLRRHQKASHEHFRKFCKVPGCDRDFTNNAAVRYHMAQVHGIFDKSQERSCEICGQQFVTKMTYEYHKKSEHKIGKVFHCPMKDEDEECGLLTFPASTAVTSHMKSKHGIIWVYDRESRAWGPQTD